MAYYSVLFLFVGIFVCIKYRCTKNRKGVLARRHQFVSSVSHVRCVVKRSGTWAIFLRAFRVPPFNFQFTSSPYSYSSRYQQRCIDLVVVQSVAKRRVEKKGRKGKDKPGTWHKYKDGKSEGCLTVHLLHEII